MQMQLERRLDKIQNTYCILLGFLYADVCLLRNVNASYTLDKPSLAVNQGSQRKREWNIRLYKIQDSHCVIHL